MKILFTRFPLESSYGGAEVQTLSLMKGLSKRGHVVTFVGSCPVLLEAVSGKRLAVSSLSIGPPPVTKWGAISFLWRQYAMQKKIILEIKNLAASRSPLAAIFMLSLSEKLLLTPWALQNGINVFWIEHDMVGRWLTKNPWLSGLRQLSQHVTTITVSELSRKIYLDLEWPENRTIAIPDGVKTENVIPPLPNPLPRGEGRYLHIGCIARLTKDKGVDLLIEAVKDVPNVTLKIVGKGREEENIKKLIEKVSTLRDASSCHGEEESADDVSNHHDEAPQDDTFAITLTPWIDDLSAFYQSLDVLVLPSRKNDPFGMVAAEAMMRGIPVVVTDQCGIAGYLEDELDALVVPADSSLALKKAITKMQNPKLREHLARHGKQTAHEQFTVEKMVDRYENLITS
jgi:glycosyltransferase involved in cell wall biosynthesis